MQCGKPLPADAGNQRKYCSPGCKSDARRAVVAAKPRPDTTCPGCGAAVKQTGEPGKNRKFCSVRCRDRSYARRDAAARKARNRRWREANAETLAEKKRAYREANIERHKAWDRARYLRKREEILAQVKDYYAAHSEEVRARVARHLDEKRQDPQWVAKERERARQKWHKASEKQKEAWRRRGQRRQSRKNLQRVGEVSAADWDAILRIWDHSCAYCGKRLEYNEHGNLIVDIEHIIPISRGGPHSIGNLVPSCEGCNHRKSWKLLVEWRYSPRGMKRLAKGPLAPAYRPLPLP